MKRRMAARGILLIFAWTDGVAIVSKLERLPGERRLKNSCAMNCRHALIVPLKGESHDVC
jgi:hypothetical protein